MARYIEASQIKMNWVCKVYKMEKLLSILGKIIIIKSLVASQVTHLFHALRPPEDILAQIHRLLYNFIWPSTERVKRNVMEQNYDKGGLKMYNIWNCAKITGFLVVKKIMEEDGLFNDIPRSYLCRRDCLIFKYNATFLEIDRKEHLPQHYSALIKLWIELKDRLHDLHLDDVIWLNHLVNKRTPCTLIDGYKTECIT